MSFFFKFIHLFIYAYIVWAISPPCPPLSPSLSPPPLLPGRTCSAHFSNFVRVDISNNRKDIAFLLVEIRITI
jgi:hypothetical protein